MGSLLSFFALLAMTMMTMVLGVKVSSLHFTCYALWLMGTQGTLGTRGFKAPNAKEVHGLGRVEGMGQWLGTHGWIQPNIYKSYDKNYLDKLISTWKLEMNQKFMWLTICTAQHMSIWWWSTKKIRWRPWKEIFPPSDLKDLVPWSTHLKHWPWSNMPISKKCTCSPNGILAQQWSTARLPRNNQTSMFWLYTI